MQIKKAQKGGGESASVCGVRRQWTPESIEPNKDFKRSVDIPRPAYEVFKKINYKV